MCETGRAAEQSDRLLLFCVINEIKKIPKKERLLFGGRGDGGVAAV